ncbi:hypothetical protein F5Y16DRAFT_395176 [Xylariaceae sp. FL0255]|nr:hypothetical protein F5Y16DRAFT_395176 [Xylariaceae sp. FL0255]
MVLAKAEALNTRGRTKIPDYSHMALWVVIYRMLWYAGQVEAQDGQGAKLVKLLDYFDKQVSRTWRKAQQAWPTKWRLTGDQHWSRKQNPGGKGQRNTFLGIIIRFAILPYVRAKLVDKNQVRLQKITVDTVSLLENAESNFKSVMWKGFPALPEIPHER